MQSTVEFIVFVTLDQLPVPVMEDQVPFVNDPVQLSKEKIYPDSPTVSFHLNECFTAVPAVVEFVEFNEY